jgi:tetratricopeptide (TPR) repeat protein
VWTGSPPVWTGSPPVWTGSPLTPFQSGGFGVSGGFAGSGFGGSGFTGSSFSSVGMPGAGFGGGGGLGFPRPGAGFGASIPPMMMPPGPTGTGIGGFGAANGERIQFAPSFLTASPGWYNMEDFGGFRKPLFSAKDLNGLPRQEQLHLLRLYASKTHREAVTTYFEKALQDEMRLLPGLRGMQGEVKQPLWQNALLTGEQLRQAQAINLLYQRPSFTNDYRFLNDLTQHAPGLDTTFADIQAVLEAEANMPAAARGEVDAEARRLINRARAAGWQRVTYPSKDGQPAFTILVNGAGQFAHERVLPFGLREVTICDGKEIVHLYEEIGLGARRAVGRAHRRELVQVVPWLVLPADDLSHGADVKLVNDTTVAILPHGSAKDADGKPVPAAHYHLVFGADGALSERQIVEHPSGKVLARETYDRGTVSWVDVDGKTASTRALDVAAVKAPNLRRDTSKLVVVPMPLRTAQHILAKVNGPAGKAETDFTNWKEEDAIALLASECCTRQTGLAGHLFSQRFHAQRDRRLGFYTLLLASPDIMLHGFNYRFAKIEGAVDILKEHPKAPLAKLIAHVAKITSQKTVEAIGDIGAPKNGFLAQYIRYRNLHLEWLANVPPVDGAHVAAMNRTIAALKDCPSSELAWGIVEAMQARCNNRSDVQEKLAEAYRVLAEHPELATFARHERAQHLRQAGKEREAIAEFRGAYFDLLKSGQVPRIDVNLRDAFGGAGAKPFADFMHEAAAEMTTQKHPAAILLLARQAEELGEPALAEDLMSRALETTKDAGHRLVLLSALNFFKRHQKFDRVDALLKEALADQALERLASLWRLGAEMAQRKNALSRAVACLEKAMDLEFEALPDVVNVQTVRNDYQGLLNHYQQLAQAMNMLDVPVSKEFLAKVVRATDRWRALDPEATQACQLAAQILQTVGGREATDLAWEYLTTPIAHKPNEAAPWVALANALRPNGNVDLVDRAFAAAFAAEPTNAQILWDRAQHLMQAGRGEQARPLFEQLANGQWQDRFAPLRQQARGMLVPGVGVNR